MPEFLDAVDGSAAGGTALDPEVVAQLLVRRSARDPLDALTPREREVLRLMAEGRTNTAIAAGAARSPTARSRSTSRRSSPSSDLAPDDTDNRRVLAVLRYLES